MSIPNDVRRRALKWSKLLEMHGESIRARSAPGAECPKARRWIDAGTQLRSAINRDDLATAQTIAAQHVQRYLADSGLIARYSYRGDL